MKKKIDNLIKTLILSVPLLDFFTVTLNFSRIGVSICEIIKLVFLILCIIYIIRNSSYKKNILFIFIYFVIYFLYLIFNKSKLEIEIMFIIKVFYLPVLIMFFSNYENKNINKKTILNIFLFYFLLFIIQKIFRLGFNVSETYLNTKLNLYSFCVYDELVNVFIILLPVVILYLIESNSYILKVIFLLLIIITVFLIRSKVYYLSLIIIAIYFVITYRKKIISFLKRCQLKFLLCVLTILLILIIYIPKTEIFTNISLCYYGLENSVEFISQENSSYIIDMREHLIYLKNANRNYLEKSNILEKLFGYGNNKTSEIAHIEIDIFDIFYSIGIVGAIIYIISFIGVLKLKSIYKFSFVLVIVISCFSGHALLNPMVNFYMALLFIVSKNDNGQIKRDCLLVSNFYPSKIYPHYGVFVKNVCSLLTKNNIDVDKVVIYKTNNKLTLFYYYLRLYIVSFLKSIWNNYDYIYVHFISHSTHGIIIPYLCSKNTKLILNVHGNDVIADYDAEMKNEKISAKYLKLADTVVSPSNYFKNLLEKKYNVSSQKIIVYPSGGVDQNKFKNVDKNIAIKHTRLKVGVKYFGYVSRIEKDKGYDTLILTINELKKQRKLNNIKFLIVGSGTEENILNELIEKYKLKRYIERRTLVSQDELVYIYNSLEAFINPTRRKSESLSLTGLEAMSCETLVIGSNKYGPSDYLVKNENCIIFTSDDYKSLAQKIDFVLKMSDKDKKRLINNAKEKSKEYGYENTKDIILNIFK